MGLSSLFGNVLKGTANNVVNQAQSSINQKMHTSGQKLTQNLSSQIGKSVNKAMCKKEDIVFTTLPKNLNQLLEQEGSDLRSPFRTAAFMVAALNAYVEDKNAGIAMIEYLNGPEDFSTFQMQSLDFALAAKPYVVRSYFKGATPENDYTPSTPYTVHVTEDGLSYQEEGYCRLYVTSGGADNPRQVLMRKKGEQWFIWQTQQQLVGDIRLPRSQDKWS